MTIDRTTRTSGVILHVTSLPGPYGIGDLGAEARRFVDWLVEAEQGLWQVLPLHPPEQKWFSPYAAFSAFALNPWLLSLDRLVELGWLEAEQVASAPEFPAERVDFRRMAAFKWPLLVRAAERFEQVADDATLDAFRRFCAESAAWLDDYALFMALLERYDGASWNEWPAPLALRRPEALDRAREELAATLQVHRILQFELDRQWRALRAYANERGVRLLGDIPIYVAHKSADVWADPRGFSLDPKTGAMRLEAGVPADGFFSDEGQPWGMPVFNWRHQAADGYRFWAARLRRCFALYDHLRIDHFRGFEAYWVFEHGGSASNGQWVEGPGRHFFESMQEQIGELPIFVEDLGFITDGVHALRRACDFPGMTVVQFGFDGTPTNPYQPHACGDDLVMYVGSHDLPSARDWFENAPEEVRARFLAYLEHSEAVRVDDGISADAGMHWQLVRLAWASAAPWALCQLQDVLGLGAEGRMNTPGVENLRNWSWRFTAGALDGALARMLAGVSRAHGRTVPGREIGPSLEAPVARLADG
ncbi:MAG: 4-alpha-glucanotransferase [Acidobacteriota bacterium]